MVRYAIVGGLLDEAAPQAGGMAPRRLLAAAPLVVTADQRRALEQMAHLSSLPQRQVIQARGLMLAADGVPTLRVAKQLGVSPDRVRRWRSRFEAEGVEAVGRIAPGVGASARSLVITSSAVLSDPSRSEYADMASVPGRGDPRGLEAVAMHAGHYGETAA